jgi:hypothetical protein
MEAFSPSGNSANDRLSVFAQAGQQRGWGATLNFLV